METYRKVTKPNARKMYNSGCTILLLPCKVSDSAVNGSHPWVKPFEISFLDTSESSNQFDRSVNLYEYYNCNAELGYYAHYFVSEEDLSNYEMCKLMCN